MSRLFRFSILLSLISLSFTVAARAATIDFEDIAVPTDSSLAPASGGELINAAAGYSTSGGTPVSPAFGVSTFSNDTFNSTTYTSNFTSGALQLPNSYTTTNYPAFDFSYSSYAEWAISNVNQVAVPSQSDYQAAGMDDYATPYEYSAYNLASPSVTGGGAGGSANYGVFFDDGVAADETLTLPAGTSPTSIDITNTTYAALSMRYGDTFAFPFQSQGDLFQLTITGTKADGSSAGSPVLVTLADFDSGNLFIMHQWTTVPLSGLAGAQTLSFALSSSGPDSVDSSGVATPFFFAADNLVLATPEPSSLVLTLIAGLCAAAVAARKTMRRRHG